MSRALSQEYKRVTIAKRNREVEVRVPQFPPKMKGGKLLFSIGRLALKETNDNYKKSCALMEDWFRADHTLFLRTQDLRLLCKDTIDSIRRATRAPMKAMATAPSNARMTGIIRRASSELMKWALPQGMELGEATRPDLELATERDRKTAAGLATNVRFYNEIMKQLPNDKAKVRDVLVEADLERFLENAKKVAA